MNKEELEEALTKIIRLWDTKEEIKGVDEKIDLILDQIKGNTGIQ